MRKQGYIPLGTLHKSGEDYLEAILVLQKQLGEVRSVDIARYMNFSKPSVSNAVSILRRAGHLTVDLNHRISLTEEGRRQAERIYERHLVLTKFFVSIGVDAQIAEQDACKLEHVISDESFEHIENWLTRMDGEPCGGDRRTGK